MSYTGDPRNNPVDRVRLVVGDTLPDPILDDETYLYLLDKYKQNENRASIAAAQMILFNLTRYTRERAGDIEVYGQDYFNNYRKTLQDWLKHPQFNESLAMPYAGGISRQDMANNAADSDTLKPTAYRGMQHERSIYDHKPEETGVIRDSIFDY